MVAAYSGQEVVEMAIQIEEKGYHFYKILAGRARQDSLKALFSWLAGQEKKHIEVFEGLREPFNQIALDGAYNWNEVSAYFRALIDTKVFPDTEERSMLSEEIDDEIGAFQIAISFEKDNILFFQEIREMVQGRDRDVISKLIAEEKSHILRLLDMKQQMIDDTD